MARLLAAAVCTFLSACTIQPPKPEPVPPELIPAGFTAAECKVVKAAEAITEDGPSATKMTMGMRSPEVSCQHRGKSVTTTTLVPSCHTKAGKPLPLSDCCMTESGSPIPACTSKLQPEE